MRGLHEYFLPDISIAVIDKTQDTLDLEVHMAWVYIVANRWRTTLYIGSTSDLSRRIRQHKSGAIPGFTRKYNCTDLLYAEYFCDIAEAREREQTLKKWSRRKKNSLNASANPNQNELTPFIVEENLNSR